MAQDITLMGATYLAVPAVLLPTSNGTAQFTDVSDTTASASDVASGKYFYTSSGVKTQGSATTPSVQTNRAYTVSGSGSATINPSSGYDAMSTVSLTVPSGTATAPTSISATGASVSTGTNTLTLSKSVSNTPRITTAGYISSGTSGSSTVSLTASITPKGATNYHPSTSNQTISSGTYLTGKQTVMAVTLTNLTADNIKNGVTVKVGDASDDDCVTSVTGTYEGSGGGGGGGIPSNLSAFVLFTTSDPRLTTSSPREPVFFESGMTWAQFVASDYNTDGYFIEDMTGMNMIACTPSRLGATVDLVSGGYATSDGNTATDTIRDGGIYQLQAFY